MPFVYNYKCNKCRFKLQGGWGYRFYVINDEKQRVDCIHPAESWFVKQVLGSDPPLDEIRKRTGFNSDCVCLGCLHQFKADFGEFGWSPFEYDISRYKPRSGRARDKRQCPKCNSTNVRTVREMVGKPCPKCKKGVIEENWTGVVS